MERLLLYVSCSSAALMAGAGLYCFCRWALARRHLLLRPLYGLKRGTIAVLLALAIGATIFAQKSGGDRSGEENEELRIENGELEGGSELPRSDVSEVTNLCFTSISVASNETTLGVSWPLDFIGSGSKIDLFAFVSLDAAEQVWLAEHEVASAETNWTLTVDTSCLATGTEAYPSMLFFSAAVRSPPDDLRDTDGDSIPDVYEFYRGTNPYVPDCDFAQKLHVGPTNEYADIAAALAGSTAYSVIELDPSVVHDAGGMGVRMPAHPVMVCSPPGSCAVVRATGLSAFLFDTNSTSRTLFKNIYILLDAQSGVQAGFWVGGNLPWNAVAASASFEDVYVRMPRSGVEYFGWLLYNASDDAVSLSRCTVNASGSEWVYGVQSFGTSPLVLENCSFVNFPPNGAKTSCGILLRSMPGIGGGADVAVSRCIFDESFTNAVMFGRLEGGESNVLSVADCIVPRNPLEDYPIDDVSGLVVTNAALTWSGFPQVDSPSVALNIGALLPFANAPAFDTDGDGLYDYNEIYERGTDPFLADSDLDGIPDGIEIGQGTDPTDPHSFIQNLHVSVTNVVSLNHAAYVAWGYDPAGWETNELVEFPSGTGTNTYTNASANAAVFVKAFCDLDDDGYFNPSTDILLVRPIPQGAVAHINFVFGDVDGDGVADVQERTDGTDPYDHDNFLVNLLARFDGLFHTTNSLSVQILMNTNVVHGPVLLDATNRVWTFGPQSIVAVTGGRPKFVFWDDANFNGVCDVSETQVSYTPSPFAHDMAFTNRLSYGAFDMDGDGMLDWWELQHGLCPTNAADAVEDTDGDTLLNIHEFLSQTDPNVTDGTNTLIYSLIHSVDDRLVGKNPQDNWKIYMDGTIATYDTNCWLYGVSLPNTIQQQKSPGSDVWIKYRTVTVIGNQHVLYATHCNWCTNTMYRFLRPNGELVTRTLIATNIIAGTDITVGILDEPLPSDISPVKMLPENFPDYIGNGRYLPSVRIDQTSRCVVQEIKGLPSNAKTLVNFRVSNDETREWFRHDAVNGDSAHQNFFVLGNETVYLFSTWCKQNGGKNGTGCLPILSCAVIESMVNEMCIEHGITNMLSIQQFDFSTWGSP